MDLWSVCVPPALQALDRAEALWRKGEAAGCANARLSADMFDFETQLETVAGFALRTCLPVVGRDVPDLSGSVLDRIGVARTAVAALTPVDFDGAAHRRIVHRAGFADLEQGADDYVVLFALPNLWFHLSMAYAVLRAQGVPLTKGDFDGLHVYPPGFCW